MELSQNTGKGLSQGGFEWDWECSGSRSKPSLSWANQNPGSLPWAGSSGTAPGFQGSLGGGKGGGMRGSSQKTARSEDQANPYSIPSYPAQACSQIPALIPSDPDWHPQAELHHFQLLHREKIPWGSFSTRIPSQLLEGTAHSQRIY